ncbi:MAG: UvrD-helicase domain-containing protein [Leptospirales bacterium]|nr:UvrD-helicase domain-containing protein [Leptospirales bacterium]
MEMIPALDPSSCPLDGLNLIEASAGCGKTHAITRLWLRLLLEANLRPAQILTVTFSEAAAAELRSRLHRTLREALEDGADSSDLQTVVQKAVQQQGRAAVRQILQRAQHEFEEAAIYTIHAFCATTLEQEALASGAPIEVRVQPDESSLLAEAAFEFWDRLMHSRAEQTAAAALQNLLSPEILYDLAMQWSRRPSLQLFGLRPEALQQEAATPQDALQIYSLQQLQLWLDQAPQYIAGAATRRGEQTYRDMLGRLAAALRDDRRGPGLREALWLRYPAALVDEFQDTDRLQWEIFAALAERSTLFLIGDPKQSIYRFRSADLPTYFLARDRAQAAQRLYGLHASRRFSEAMTRALNAIFAERDGAAPPFLHEKLPSPPLQSARPSSSTEPAAALQIQLLWPPDGMDGQWKIADLRRRASVLAVQAIAAELSNGRPPHEIAVLTLKHSEAEELAADLRSAGIAAALRRRQSVFGEPAALELAALMHAMLAPEQIGLARRAFVTALWGLRFTDLADEGLMEECLAQLRALESCWRTRGALAFSMELQTLRQMHRRLAGDREGLRWIANLGHLSELLETSPAQNPREQLRWLEARIAAGRDEEDSAIRQESESPAVQLLTVHASKGLEFPSVYIPFFYGPSARRDRHWIVADDLLPDLATDPTAPQSYCAPSWLKDALDRPWADAATLKRAEESGALQERQERIRLYYVALTRARERLTLFVGPARDALHTAPARGKAVARDAATHLLFWRPLARPPAAREQLVDALNNLQQLSDGAIQILDSRNTQSAPSPFPISAASSVEEEYALGATPQVSVGLRWTSFTAEYHRAQQQQSMSTLSDDARDLDQSPLPPAAEDPAALAATRFNIEPSASEAGAVGLHGFPSGASAGIFFHSWLESILQLEDLRDTQKLLEITQRELASYRPLHTHDLMQRWLKPMLAMLEALLRRELAPGLRLRDLPRRDRSAEMRFQFADAGQRDVQWIGAIDLTLRCGQRYYLLDWKSNRLGPDFAAYNADALDRAMQDGGYLQQAQVYCAALRRLLRQSIVDYQDERHFGGALYVFLRGINPEAADDDRSGLVAYRPDANAAAPGLLSGETP